MKKFISIFYIVCGVGIIGLWIMLLSTNQVPEVETTPIEISFHIVIEVLMGVCSLVAGIFLLKGLKYAKELLLFSSGVLFYSVINSSGYYAQLGEAPMIIMFLVILIVVCISVYQVVTGKIDI